MFIVSHGRPLKPRWARAASSVSNDPQEREHQLAAGQRTEACSAPSGQQKREGLACWRRRADVTDKAFRQWRHVHDRVHRLATCKPPSENLPGPVMSIPSMTARQGDPPRQRAGGLAAGVNEPGPGRAHPRHPSPWPASAGQYRRSHGQMPVSGNRVGREGVLPPCYTPHQVRAGVPGPRATTPPFLTPRRSAQALTQGWSQATP